MQFIHDGSPMKTADRVLELLYDRREGFFSLDELAAAAGKRRQRVEAALRELEDRGHRLEFGPSHGVRLVTPVKLDAVLIERNLGTQRVGRNAIAFDEVDSTNDTAMDSARHEDADGLVVTAEFQRAGRGRLGRTWLSPPGENLMFSVLLTDSESLQHEAVTIAAGLAVAEGIEKASGAECELKWPNDVLLDGRKVAGILVEIRSPGFARGRRCMVIGIGINVNASPPPDKVDFPATSLAGHIGHSVERLEVLRDVLIRLDAHIGGISSGSFAGLHDAWISRCGMLNRRVEIASAGRNYTGRVLDVSPLEGLILAVDSGQIVHLPAECSTVLAMPH